MNIVLADVKPGQTGQMDTASERTAAEDKFSRVFDQQLNREETSSDQVKYPQVIETKEIMMDITDPVSSPEQILEQVDSLGSDGISQKILVNPHELESAKLIQTIDYKVDPVSVSAIEQMTGEALPPDGSSLPPVAIQVSQQPVEKQPIPAQQPVTVEHQSITAQQQSTSVQHQSAIEQHQSTSVQQQLISTGQQSVPVPQSLQQKSPGNDDPLGPLNLKADRIAAVPPGAESVALGNNSVAGALESAVVIRNDAMTDKISFGKAGDFQFTNPGLNSESEINNNLFRSHSPTVFSGLNQSPQSLPPHLETLPLANPRDQAALSGGLGDRIQWMVNQKLNTATIRMDPPMLGRLEVHIQVADDMTNVTINTQHAQTRDLIENASMRLREYLQENGYENVNVDVSHQQQQQASDQDGVGDDFLAGEQSPGSEPDIKHEAAGNRYFSSDSVVDYFA